MARLFTSGFELQSVTAGVEFENITGSPTINTTTIRPGGGAASLRINPSSAAHHVRTQFHASSPTSKTFYARAYIYIATAPGTQTVIFAFSATTTTQLSIRMNTDRTLEMWADAFSTQLGSDSAALATNTWYRIELMATINGASQMTNMEARINGTAFATATGAYSASDSIRIGNLTSTTCDIYFDDIAINDSTGSFENSWPGEGHVVHLKPNGAGTSAQWRIGAGAGANYENVDETTPDDATTYVDTNGRANNDTDSYTITDPPTAMQSGDTVKVVHVGARFARSAANTSDTFQVRVTAGGNTDSSATIQPNTTTWRTNAIAVPRTYPLTTYDMPGASTTAWSKSDLTSAEIGMIAISTANSNDAYISAVWLAYEYAPNRTTLTIRPNANGDLMEWDAEGGDYQRVDESVSDGDTTRLYTPTDNKVGLFNLDAPGISSGTITRVRVNAVVKGLDPVDNTFQIGVKMGGTEYWSANKLYNSTAYITVYEDWATNPNTSSAWTWTDIGNLQAGVKRITGGGQALTQLYVEVEYVAAASLVETTVGTLPGHIAPIWKSPVNTLGDFTSLATATGETVSIASNGWLANGLNVNQNNSASTEVGVRIENAHLSSPPSKRFEYWFKVRSGASFTGEIAATHAWYDTAGSAYGGDLAEIRFTPVSVASGYLGKIILRSMSGIASAVGATNIDMGVWNKATLSVEPSSMRLFINRATTVEAMVSHASIANLALGAIATGKYFAQGLNGTMIFDNFALRAAPTGIASTVGGRLSDMYDSWLQRYLAFEGGIIRPFDEGNNDTPNYAAGPDIVSEGQAYGMLLAVHHNDKDTFDLIENFNRNVMERTNYPSSTASLRAQGARLMGYHYNPHVSAVSLSLTAGPNEMYDWNYATDGDIDRAKALLYAQARWGRTSGASINYIVRAKEILDDLITWGHTAYSGKRYLHGDYFGWLNNPHETNPSYLDMTTLRLGRQWFSDQFHDQSIQGMYDIIRQSTSSTGSLMTQWGLPPNWIKWNTTTGLVELNSSRDTKYSYDAFRTVYRVYLDYDFYNEPQAQRLLAGQLYTSFASEYNRSGIIKAEYNHDGSVAGDYEKTLFYAVNIFPFIVAGATLSTASIFEGRILNTYYGSASIPSGGYWSDAPVTPSSGTPTYYNSSWVQLGVGAKTRLYPQWGIWKDTSGQLW
jgi:endo-1,4-beta-D-glucanase Y